MEKDDFRFFLKNIEIIHSFDEIDNLQNFRGLFTEIDRKSVRKNGMLEVEIEEMNKSLDRMRKEGEEERRRIEEEERRMEKLERRTKKRK